MFLTPKVFIVETAKNHLAKTGGALHSKNGRDRSRQLRLWLVERRDRSWFWRPVVDLQRGQEVSSGVTAGW